MRLWTQFRSSATELKIDPALVVGTDGLSLEYGRWNLGVAGVGAGTPGLTVFPITATTAFVITWGLCVGLRVRLCVGLRVRLCVRLCMGLLVGLRMGLSMGLRAGLRMLLVLLTERLEHSGLLLPRVRLCSIDRGCSEYLIVKIVITCNLN